MATVYRDPKSGVYRILFRFSGEQFHKSLKTDDAKKAEAWKTQIEETLHDLERGRLVLPPDVDFWEFVKTDGKREKKVKLAERLDLDSLCRWYFNSLPEGAKESETYRVEAIHLNHVKRLLGAGRKLDMITGNDLQDGYVNERAKEAGRYGRTVQADTIRKEIETLQMVWNRAYRNRLPGVNGECPSGELKFPKKKDKPPFQTRQQIEQTVARGGLSKADVKELWDSLFLDLGQIAEVLEHVRAKETNRRYFSPLLVFVAHTGTRLSEALRSQVQDFFFQEMKVRIRERKRDNEAETFRWVDLSSFLSDTMRDWLADHPGGTYAFCRVANKKFHPQTLHDDFEWFMKGSKWEVLKGFHVFRHSFASNLALKGTDQRVIDDLMGHQTEEMRKRYRHLFPQQKQAAVATLFG